MRLAAAAAANRGVQQLLQAQAAAVCAGPAAAQLSTSSAAASLWRQALAAAASALGSAPAASGTNASSPAPSAAAEPTAGAPVQPLEQRLTSPAEHEVQQAQQPDQAQQQASSASSDERQQQEQLGAWGRGAKEFSRRQRQQNQGSQPAAANGQLASASEHPGRRSSRRARRRDKQRPPEAYAVAAAGQQAGEPADGSDGTSERSGKRGSGSKKGRRDDGGKGDAGGRSASSGSGTSTSSGSGGPDSEVEVVGAGEEVEVEECTVGGACPLPPARILQDDSHPIREGDISRAAWLVLARLRAAGHEVYVVGGTVRDLLLGGTPKDYDLLTSAEPHQVKRLFGRCIIVGRSFPVCHVYAEGTMIEVSSFSTQADTRLIPLDASVHMIGRQKRGNGEKRAEKGPREGATWAEARSANASRRDFTVNGLLYDPFSRLLFDSVGGLEDCEARRLRTICPPSESFAADPARILRGVRLASRAGLELDPATAAAIEEHAALIGQLPQGRLQMELANLLGYGAAQQSLALMWRLGLLDMLLPQHALYLRRHKVPRAPRSASSRRRPELLFELAAELDEHVHPQKPVDPSVWVALLAAPLVADRISELWKQAQPSREAGSHGEAASEGAAADAAGGSGSGLSERVLDDSWRLEFVEPYQQIVSEVLDSMLQPLDATMMQQLGRQAKKHGQQLRESGGGRRRRKRGSASPAEPASGAADAEQPLLPCVLARSCTERAAALLHMEAELRGRPELQQLLERSGWPGTVTPAFPLAAGVSGGDGGSELHGQQPEQQAQQPPQPREADQAHQRLGRHPLHHLLWQRLERAAGSAGSSKPGAADEAAEAADGEAEPLVAAELPQRKHGKRRALSPEERLVLGILSDPRFDYRGRTTLPPAARGWHAYVQHDSIGPATDAPA